MIREAPSGAAGLDSRNSGQRGRLQREGLGCQDAPGRTRGGQTRLDGWSAHAESTLCVELTGIFVKSPGGTSGTLTFTLHTGGAHPEVWSPSPMRRRRPAPHS